MPLPSDKKESLIGNRNTTRIAGWTRGKKRFVIDPAELHPRGVYGGGIAPGFPDITTGVLYAFDNTPSITETYFEEVMLPFPCRITGVAIHNGSAVAGNVTVGLADTDGIPLPGIVSASTAQATANVLQKIPFALPYDAEGPARFFIMLQFSSASARYRGHKFGIHYCGKDTAQTYGTLKAFTPPTAWLQAGSFHALLY